jgi:hypothetical protein
LTGCSEKEPINIDKIVYSLETPRLKKGALTSSEKKESYSYETPGTYIMSMKGCCGLETIFWQQEKS